MTYHMMHPHLAPFKAYLKFSFTVTSHTFQKRLKECADIHQVSLWAPLLQNTNTLGTLKRPGAMKKCVAAVVFLTQQ